MVRGGKSSVSKVHDNNFMMRNADGVVESNN
jgi:hypothetical protein